MIPGRSKRLCRRGSEQPWGRGLAPVNLHMNDVRTATNRPAALPRFCAYSLVGLMGFAVQLAALLALSTLTGLRDWVAVALAVECAILHNFMWHERWTWVDRTGGSCEGVMTRLATFNLATGGFSIASNLGLTAFFATSFGLPLVVANACAVASLSLLTFLTSDRLVFAPAER
jgi:putative flippase GtrA